MSGVFLERVTPLLELPILEDFYADARKEDIREWETAGDQPFLFSLAVALKDAWVVWADGRAVCSYGLNPTGWLILTNGATRHLLSLHKLFVKFLSEHETLECCADSRNELHLRWLLRVGFVPYDLKFIRGVTFILFSYTKKEQQAACASP